MRVLIVGSFLLFLGAARPFSCAAMPPAPFVNFSYRGDAKTELARVDGHPISEKDLYLFLLLDRGANPNLANGWNNPGPADIARERKDQLRRAVRRMAALMAASPSSQLPAKSGLSPYQEFVALRWTLFPAYALVWADEIVAPEVKIYPEDIEYFVQKNQELFSAPENCEFYWALFPCRSDDSPDLRQRRRQTAEELRASLERSALSLQSAAADWPPTTTLTRRDGRFELLLNTGSLDPLLEAPLRQLRKGELSQVIEARDGFHLIELAERHPPALPPTEQIQARAREILFLRFLPQQADYALSEQKKRIHPVDRGALWPYLAPETVLLDIGRTDLTREDFTAAFAELFPKNSPPDMKRIRQRASEFVEWEVIAQEVETQFLDSDEMIKAARPIAESLSRWRLVQMASAAAAQANSTSSSLASGSPGLAMNDDSPASSTLDQQADWKRHSEEIAPSKERHYYRLAAPVKDNSSSGQAWSSKPGAEVTLNDLEKFRVQAQEVLDIYRASLASGQALDPAPILSRWKSTLGVSNALSAEDLGWRAVRAPGPWPGADGELPLLDIGRMSAPRYEPSGQLALYFSIQERPLAPPSAQERKRLALEYAGNAALARLLDDTFAKLERTGRFQWNPALAP